MKKLTLALLFLVTLLAVRPAQAQAILRVNNTGITGTGIFGSLQGAHDAATAGDIVYVEPSGISYGSLIATKRLTIIGNGYLHGEQAVPLTVDPRPSIVEDVTFRAGSEGSRITGMTANNRIMVNANNITVERNRVAGNGISIGRDDFVTGNPATISSGVIRQNYIEAAFSFRMSAPTTVAGVLLSNNIILGDINGGNASNLNSVLISNNVVGNRAGTGGGGIDVDNCVLKNNIVTRPGATFTLRANSSANNVGTGTQFGSANGNQQNVSLGSIFAGTGTDGQFGIVAGGPADNTGEGGADCGIFGGSAPYIVAGVPSVPTIFEYSQAVSGNTLNATISTQSNK